MLRDVLSVVSRVVDVPAHCKALVAAGMPHALVAVAAFEPHPSPNVSLAYSAHSAVLTLLLGLLTGPFAKETTDAVAASGLQALFDLVTEGGDLGERAAECVLAIQRRLGLHPPRSDGGSRGDAGALGG